MTRKMKTTPRQSKIILIVLEKEPISSSAVHAELIKAGEDISLVTVKRILSRMAASGFLTVLGAGPATAYRVSQRGRFLAPIDAKEYCSVEPDKRFGSDGYNPDLFAAIPADIFSEGEQEALDRATKEYEERIKGVPKALREKELERLVIELAWKSSQIEGNTHTLLETEKLLLGNARTPGRSREEVQMILNHKEAFHFIHQNVSFFKQLNRNNLEKLHSLLVKDLGIGFDLRQKPVGITGSKYRPPAIGYQVAEALDELCRAVAGVGTPYGRALLALAGLSYIQPFDDGNKRTSRLMANALLMAHGLAPLSYRNLNVDEYRQAMLVFYEINSIAPIKRIFIEQYEFAAGNYAVK